MRFSANMFVFGDFNIRHKGWVTYSGGTDRPGEFCYNFSISNAPTQMVNCPDLFPDCDSYNPVLFNLFTSPDASICSTMAVPPLGNSDHVHVAVSIELLSNSKWDALFYCKACDHSFADWDGLCDHLGKVLWENIFKVSAFAADDEFCGWFQVGINVDIPHHKYHVKPHSSPWFSADFCAAVIVPRNHFFCLYHQSKSSESKLKIRQASNHCTTVLQTAKPANASKTKESILSQKIGSGDFWQIANSVLKKDKSTTLLLFNGLEVLSSASDKAKLVTKNFSESSNLYSSGISFTIFSSRTNLKLHNISVTHKMVEKVITNLDSSKVSSPDFIPVMLLKNCGKNFIWQEKNAKIKQYSLQWL